MPQQINKLIAIIDQLLVWLNENPYSSIPENEKKRLMIALKGISNKGTISQKEWDKIKPKHKPIERTRIIYDNSAKKEYDKALAEIKQMYNQHYGIKKTYESAFKPNAVKPKFKEPSINKDSNERENTKIKFTDPLGKQWVLCTKCKSTFTPKKISKHYQKCQVEKPKPAKVLKTPKPKRKRFPITGSAAPQYQVEKKLDGSHGYHDFSRETGRFGSHSSYDNMGDESKP